MRACARVCAGGRGSARPRRVCVQMRSCSGEGCAEGATAGGAGAGAACGVCVCAQRRAPKDASPLPPRSLWVRGDPCAVRGRPAATGAAGSSRRGPRAGRAPAGGRARCRLLAPPRAVPGRSAERLLLPPGHPRAGTRAPGRSVGRTGGRGAARCPQPQQVAGSRCGAAGPGGPWSTGEPSEPCVSSGITCSERWWCTALLRAQESDCCFSSSFLIKKKNLQVISGSVLGGNSSRPSELRLLVLSTSAKADSSSVPGRRVWLLPALVPRSLPVHYPPSPSRTVQRCSPSSPQLSHLTVSSSPSLCAVVCYGRAKLLRGLACGLLG